MKFVETHLGLVMTALGPLGAVIGGVVVAFRNWNNIVPIVQSMVTGVADRIRGNLYPQLEDLKSRLSVVGDAFHRLYDRVVGHSYIPDMVNEIGEHLGRLDGLMVKPAERMTAATAAAFAKLKTDVGALLDQLFPEDVQDRQVVAQIALLNKALEAGAIDWNKYADARARVSGATGALPVSDDIAHPQPLDQVQVPQSGVIDDAALDRVLAKTNAIVAATGQWKTAIADIGKGLSDLLANDLSAIVSGTMKLKDLWKDLLAFGIKTLTSSSGPLGQLFGGARASGGPVLGGSAYLVGERGPEIFQPSGSGRIVSNADSRRILGGDGGSRAVVQNWTVYANDADSFRRSEGQMLRRQRRALRA